MDQLFHRRENLVLGWAENLLRVLRVPLAAGEFGNRLFHDAHGLAHFFAAHEIAIVAVTFRANRNIKFVLFVAAVWTVFAQIKSHAATSQIRTSDAVRKCVFLRNHANVDGAIEEDFIARQQTKRLFEDRQKLIAERVHPIDPTVRHIASDTTDAGVTGCKARTGQFFKKFVQFFALRERIEKHTPCSNIDAVRAETH